jgi:hypothetical protein
MLEADSAKARVIQSKEQPRQRALPTSGATEQTENTARLQLKQDIFENQIVLIIAKRDFVKFDRYSSRI